MERFKSNLAFVNKYNNKKEQMIWTLKFIKIFIYYNQIFNKFK